MMALLSTMFLDCSRFTKNFAKLKNSVKNLSVLFLPLGFYVESNLVELESRTHTMWKSQNFLTLIFYVKSKLVNLESQNMLI